MLLASQCGEENKEFIPLPSALTQAKKEFERQIYIFSCNLPKHCLAWGLLSLLASEPNLGI